MGKYLDWLRNDLKRVQGHAVPKDLVRALEEHRAEVEAECMERGHLTAQDLKDMREESRRKGIAQAIAVEERMNPDHAALLKHHFGFNK